ncbi:MAG: hypothetical protein O7F16_01805 [Acidobacteria bacterium]|nr:hypothetical protein [Acidobacteriota bacterium]
MTEERLTHLEFVLRAIEKLHTEKSLGIHSVYSGFNNGFREYFEEDPVPITIALAKETKIVTRPVRGGVMIYRPGEAPAAHSNPLAKMGLKPPASKSMG